MKIMTVLGTRPEIIRLSAVIPLLDAHAGHILVHTGQNYDDRLSRIFFEELGIRTPDVSLGIRAATSGSQMGQIIERAEALFLEHRPDRLLLLGDTNSGLSAIMARRLGIPVYHMEAGNRCYDDRVPEEVNRRVIDHSSTVLLPYTERSRENLLAEGIPGSRIHVTGNPIKQVIDRFAPRIAASNVLAEWGLSPRQYFLVTAHRSENVDSAMRLESLLEGLAALHREYGYPVIYPGDREAKPNFEPLRMYPGDQRVDSNTPPAFLFHAHDDAVVPAENSIRFYLALKKANVEADLHIFRAGGHGFGIRGAYGPIAMWTRLCEEWLSANSMAQ